MKLITFFVLAAALAFAQEQRVGDTRRVELVSFVNPATNRKLSAASLPGWSESDDKLYAANLDDAHSRARVREDVEQSGLEATAHCDELVKNVGYR